ncbi:morphogenetic protein associated with SpoVID [Pullulanibacillus pueri]|uniref:LysM domain-containing protein n=1 Tax=Pullulanibacillus pueri TaxID=1437324 RepID=A0A8J2ZXW2_9BACL|nr:LysM domain-containing protein [Pullulanibacillus pueri]MBM7683278.1 morphogenetic protein associated with SpoVID [Pullulanibacillus pueri]GGH85811.1 hypothetical protein GCM10007096_32070 [Pullulanibacillus pueri]
MKIYIVQLGDTLYKIAQKHNVTLEELKKINTQLSDPDKIKPGMKIKVPSGAKAIKKKVKADKIIKEVPVKEKPVKEKPVKEKPMEKSPNKENQVNPVNPINPVKENPKTENPKVENPQTETPKKPKLKKEKTKKATPKSNPNIKKEPINNEKKDNTNEKTIKVNENSKEQMPLKHSKVMPPTNPEEITKSNEGSYHFPILDDPYPNMMTPKSNEPQMTNQGMNDKWKFPDPSTYAAPYQEAEHLKGHSAYFHEQPVAGLGQGKMTYPEQGTLNKYPFQGDPSTGFGQQTMPEAGPSQQTQKSDYLQQTPMPGGYPFQAQPPMGYPGQPPQYVASPYPVGYPYPQQGMMPPMSHPYQGYQPMGYQAQGMQGIQGMQGMQPSAADEQQSDGDQGMSPTAATGDPQYAPQQSQQQQGSYPSYGYPTQGYSPQPSQGFGAIPPQQVTPGYYPSSGQYSQGMPELPHRDQNPYSLWESYNQASISLPDFPSEHEDDKEE